jgi:hypothetical protein
VEEMKKPDEYEILERAHQAAGAHMMQKSPRADELIACLEGEIAKRDAELAACRVAVENCEVFRARIVELDGLLREVHDTYRAAIHWEDLRGTMKRIAAALSAGKDSD